MASTWASHLRSYGDQVQRPQPHLCWQTQWGGAAHSAWGTESFGRGAAFRLDCRRLDQLYHPYCCECAPLTHQTGLSETYIFHNNSPFFPVMTTGPNKVSAFTPEKDCVHKHPPPPNLWCMISWAIKVPQYNINGCFSIVPWKDWVINHPL